MFFSYQTRGAVVRVNLEIGSPWLHQVRWIFRGVKNSFSHRQISATKNSKHTLFLPGEKSLKFSKKPCNIWELQYSFLVLGYCLHMTLRIMAIS